MGVRDLHSLNTWVNRHCIQIWYLSWYLMISHVGPISSVKKGQGLSNTGTSLDLLGILLKWQVLWSSKRAINICGSACHGPLASYATTTSHLLESDCCLFPPWTLVNLHQALSLGGVSLEEVIRSRGLMLEYSNPPQWESLWYTIQSREDH